jgi:hypothetical protein
MLDHLLQVKAGNVLKIGHLIDLNRDGRMTLKHIIETWGLKERSESNWLNIGWEDRFTE